MADVDMIPRSYRNALRARRTLACYGVALILVLAAGGACAGLVRVRLARETPHLAQLRNDAARAAALQGLVAASEQRLNRLSVNARAYAALRGAGTAAALARILDAALPDGVWLDRVELARDYEPQREPGGGAAPAGATRVATQDAAGAQAWRITERVDLDGHAFDQAALATFLEALSASPALAGVRFVDGTSAQGGDATLAFRATATLRRGDRAP